MRIVAAALVATIMLAGCGSSGYKGATIVNGLSGNWQMTLQSSSSSATQETQSGFLLQSGTNVAGSFLLSGQTIAGQISCAGVGSAQGQVNGANVSVSVDLSGQSLNLTGTAANNLTSMSGSYSILAAGCGQTETGTWSANLVHPLTGSFQATFTSYNLTTPFHFTGTITQGSNTGASIATLSGSMSSNDSPCFTGATIAGVITGTSLTINILTSTGETLGKLSGTVTPDGTSITGPFKFTNASDPTVLGTCNGYGGNVTIAVQASPATT